MGDTVSQRIRFSGASAGDNQERARICAGRIRDSVFNRRTLCVIQTAKVSWDIHHRPQALCSNFVLTP
jgi:hypothetical protein